MWTWTIFIIMTSSCWGENEDPRVLTFRQLSFSSPRDPQCCIDAKNTMSWKDAKIRQKLHPGFLLLVRDEILQITCLQKQNTEKQNNFIFSDWPLNPHMLSQFYRWLLSTLMLLLKMQDVSWKQEVLDACHGWKSVEGSCISCECTPISERT